MTDLSYPGLAENEACSGKNADQNSIPATMPMWIPLAIRHGAEWRGQFLNSRFPAGQIIQLVMTGVFFPGESLSLPMSIPHVLMDCLLDVKVLTHWEQPGKGDSWKLFFGWARWGTTGTMELWSNIAIEHQTSINKRWWGDAAVFLKWKPFHIDRSLLLVLFNIHFNTSH